MTEVRSKIPSKEYLENWDKIFGKNEKEIDEKIDYMEEDNEKFFDQFPLDTD